MRGRPAAGARGIPNSDRPDEVAGLAEVVAAEFLRHAVDLRAAQLLEQLLEQRAKEHAAMHGQVERLPADGHEIEPELGGRRPYTYAHVGVTHGDGGGG